MIDPASTEGRAYIADHLGPTYDADDFAAFLEDDLIRCVSCERLFTHRYDFDLDAIDCDGVWVCEECASDPDNAAYDLASQERTYSARAL